MRTALLGATCASELWPHLAPLTGHAAPPSTNPCRFIAPWAVAPAQPAHTVRCFSEAGVQTGACCLPTLAPGVDDSAGHFQAALSHLGAALPHMAMGLADVHLWLGNEDPRFSTLQVRLSRWGMASPHGQPG